MGDGLHKCSVLTKEVQLSYLHHCALTKQAEASQTLKCFTPSFSLGGKVAFLH